MSETAIAFENVSKSYPLYHHFKGGVKNFLFHLPATLRSLRQSRYEALRDISFEVRKGENLGIIGRNGAGKSTTLGLVAGVLKPSTGRVRVEGRVSPFLELGGGFHPELTGTENIVLNGVLLGMSRKEVSRKMDEIVGFSGLGDFVHQPIRTYSSGMLARLGFSVIAYLEPEILLIDEVLSVGDKDFQQKCLEKMMGFKRSGITIVFVSHSMPEVEMICDRAIWIEDHAVRMDGEAARVTASYLASQ